MRIVPSYLDSLSSARVGTCPHFHVRSHRVSRLSSDVQATSFCRGILYSIIPTNPAGAWLMTKKVRVNGNGGGPDDSLARLATPRVLMTPNQPRRRYQIESYTWLRNWTLLVGVQRLIMRGVPNEPPADPGVTAVPWDHLSEAYRTGNFSWGDALIW